MKNLFLTLTAGLLLAACQQSHVSSENDSPDSEGTAKANTPVVQELVAETKKNKTAQSVKSMNAANSSNSGLKFTHRMSAERAQVGVPYTIELDFSGAADSSFNAEFVATPGLSLTSNASANVQMNKLGKADTQTLTFLPQQEGIHLVTIYQNGVDQKQKPSVIKVIVGNKELSEYMEKMGELVEQADGSKVISMKAEEKDPE